MEPFEHIYQEYEALVRRFLLRLTGNAHLAEELTQETFYQALRHWASFRGQSSPATWLCAIAKRLYLTSLRRKSAPLPEDAAAPEPDPAEALVQSDRQMAAHRLLHGLAEPYKEVFTLRTFGDLSHAQIGALFGKSESWARVTYYRARQMLARQAKEEWSDE